MTLTPAAERFTVPGSKPQHLLAAALALSAGVIAWMVWCAYDNYQLMERVQVRDFQIETLRGRILHLDEILTMSARMAVATGEPRWEARYRQYEPELDHAIQRVRQLTSGARISAAASSTDAANIVLVDMEHRAFDLVHAGRRDAAQTLLNSAQYEMQKQFYADGMAELAQLFGQEVLSALALQQRRAVQHMTVFAVVLPLLITVWIITLGILRRWQNTMLHSRRQLTAQARELEQLNLSLESRVAARTAALTQEIAERQRMTEEARQRAQQLEAAHAELTQTQLQLIQSAKLESVGQLAAGVAHEVKNPLAIILQGVNYLTSQVRGASADVAGVLQRMETAVKRADTVIHGLLDFSTYQELERRPLAVDAIISASLALVQYAIVANGIQVVTALEPRLPPVSVDQRKIEQVLVNVFLNAFQAMGRGGTLTVRTSLQPAAAGAPRVRIDIEDTGPGIPPERLPRLFDPFYTTKPPGQGTGLGLTVVRKIIELHDGTIEIANRDTGGTRVTVRLPIESGVWTNNASSLSTTNPA